MTHITPTMTPVEQAAILRGRLFNHMTQRQHYMTRAASASDWQRKYEQEDAAFHTAMRDEYARQLTALLGVPCPKWGATDAEFEALLGVRVAA